MMNMRLPKAFFSALAKGLAFKVKIFDLRSKMALEIS